MERRDIIGTKQYKELIVKPVRQNPAHHGFIAVRSTLSPLDFFSEIYQTTDYLFFLCRQPFEAFRDETSCGFSVFVHHDLFSEHSAVCMLNKDLSKNHALLGGHETDACFVIQKHKIQNQLFLPFGQDGEHEEDILPTETDRKEENQWNHFLHTLTETSIDLKGKIDFVFPVSIRTYEILKPLFLKFKTLPSLHYMFIQAKTVAAFDAFVAAYDIFYDKLEK
jgi:hypothetical protein